MSQMPKDNIDRDNVMSTSLTTSDMNKYSQVIFKNLPSALHHLVLIERHITVL